MRRDIKTGMEQEFCFDFLDTSQNFGKQTANLGGSNFLFDCIRGNRSANGLILSVCGQEINFEARVHIYAPLTDVNLSFLPLKVNVLSSLLSYPDISI